MCVRIAVLILTLAVGCRVADPEVAPLDVSLVQLIARPEQFDGRVVRMVGFCRIEFEGDAIYLHQDDYTHRIYRNGLWLQLTDAIKKDRASFDQRYVLVEGVFSASDKGHRESWSGSVHNIQRFDGWVTRPTARVAE